MTSGSSLPPQSPIGISNVGTLVDNYKGGGSPALALSNRLVFARAQAASMDSSDVRINRDANYAGGAPWRGYVNAALAVTTTVSPGTTSFEWAGNFIMDNFGTSEDRSENLALAWSSIKRSTGRTLAGFGQITDLSGHDPVTTSVVTEFDIYSNGSDKHSNRIFLDLQAFRADKGKGGDGTPGTVTHGVRAISADGSPITNGYTAGEGVYHGFHGQGVAEGGVLLDDVGRRAIGVDLSAAEYSSVAVALGSGQAIAFDYAEGSFSRHISVSEGRFAYTTPKGEVFKVNDRGDMTALGDVTVAGTAHVAALALSPAEVSPPSIEGSIWYDPRTGALCCCLGGVTKTIQTA